MLAASRCEPRAFPLPSAAMIDLLFGNAFESLLFGVAVLAAIPYGIWQLIKKVTGKGQGGDPNGDTRTGR